MAFFDFSDWLRKVFPSNNQRRIRRVPIMRKQVHLNVEELEARAVPTMTAGSTQTLGFIENIPGNLQKVATFTDTDPFPAQGTYTATVNWGDGTGTQPAAVSFDSAGAGFNTYDVNASHTYTEEHSPFYTVQIAITETTPGDPDDTTPLNTTATALDSDAPLSPIPVTINATEGQNVPSGSVTVAEFNDPGTDGTNADYTTTVTWTDSNGPHSVAGTVSNTPITGTTFAVTVPSALLYNEEGGSNTISTAVSDVGGQTTTVNSSVDVADAALTSVSFSPPAGVVENTPLSLVPAFTFHDTDPNGVIGDYHAVIHWGDGTPDSTVSSVLSADGQIVAAGGSENYTVEVSHNYLDELSNATFSITAIDNGDGRALNDPTNSTVLGTTSSFNVGEADSFTLNTSGLTPTEGTPIAAGTTVATINDPTYAANSASDFSATINWGSGPVAASVTGGSGSPLAVQVVTPFTYTDEGPFTYSVTIQESDFGTNPQATAQATFSGLTATVSEADTFGLVSGGLTATEGTAIGAGVTLATISDTYSANPASDFIATVDYGSGPVAATVTGGSGSNLVIHSTLPFTYPDEGTFTYSVTIQESDLGTNPQATAQATFGPLTATVLEADAFSLVSSGISAPEGSTLGVGVTLATISNVYAANSAAEFTATVNYGSGPVAATVTGGSGGNLVVQTASTFALPLDEGTFNYSVTIQEHDFGANPQATAHSTFSGLVATVTEADAFTLFSSGVAATEGTPLAAGTTLATITNAYSSNPSTDFTATVDWGSGPVAATVSGGSGSPLLVQVLTPFTYTDEGTPTYTVAIQEHDHGTNPEATAAQTFSGLVATVSEADSFTLVSASVSTAEGASLGTGTTVATVNDPTYSANVAADFTATVDFGSGPIAANVTGGGGSPLLVQLAGPFTYADEGVHAYTVVIQEHDLGTNAQATATFTGTATVTDPSVIASLPINITPSEGANFNGQLATFSDPGGAEATNQYSALINWGDGGYTVGTISYTGALGSTTSLFTVTGSHTYAEESTVDHSGNIDGTYHVTVTINHGPGLALVADNLNDTVSVIDTSNNTILSTVTSPGTGSALQTIVSKDGSIGFVTDFSGFVFPVNLTNPAAPVFGTPISTTVPDGNAGMSFTPDDNFLIVTGDGSATKFSVIDNRPASPTYLKEIGTGAFASPGPLAGDDIEWADASIPGEILVSTYFGSPPPQPITNPGVEKFTIDDTGLLTATGAVTDTGTFLSTPIAQPPNAVVIAPAPNNASAVVVSFPQQTSGQATAESLNTATLAAGNTVNLTDQNGLSAAFNPDGTIVYVLSEDGAIVAGPSFVLTGGVIDAFGYNPATGLFTSPTPLFTIGGISPLQAFYGVQPFTVSPDGTKLYVVDGTNATVDVFDATNGAPLTSISLVSGAMPAGLFIQPNTAPPVTVADTATVADAAVVVSSVASLTTINEGQTLNTLSVPDSGFEVPDQGPSNFNYNTSGSSWTFAAHTGIAANGSAFNVVNATNGNSDGQTSTSGQAAFIQDGDGTLIAGVAGNSNLLGGSFFSQTISGFSAGSVSVTFSLEARSLANLNPIEVMLDGVDLGTYTPSSNTGFTTFTTPSIAVSAGSHTLYFIGTNSSGDNTSFVDNVSIANDITVATFTDPGGPELTGGQPSPGEYSATINWGDGSAAGAGVVVWDAANSVFDVTGNHTYSEESVNNDHGSAALGVFPISVTVSHETSTQQTATTTHVQVNEVPVVLHTALNMFDTGVDGSHKNLLPDGTVDPHWTLTVSPDVTDPGPNAIVADQNNSPISSAGWFPDNTTFTSAKWIAPQGDQSTGNAPGLYIYETTFTIPAGYDPNTVDLNGRAAADDSYEIFVNGLDTFFGSSGNAAGPLQVFNISGGYFHTGVNTLDFQVTNDGTSPNPTGLLVDAISLSATLDPTEGQNTGLIPLATFADPAGSELAASDYSADVAWGDSTPDNTTGDGSGTVVITGPTNGVFTVMGSHTYADEDGVSGVNVTVTHESTSIGIGLPINVTDPSLTGVTGGQNLSPVEGQNTGSVLLATFTDSGYVPGLSTETGAADYSADIDWGDGTGIQVGSGTVVYSGTGNVFNVFGSHTYLEESGAEHPGSTPYTITVQVHHEATADPAPVTDTATVADLPVTATAGQASASGVEGQATNAIVLAKFTDPGDDGNIVSGVTITNGSSGYFGSSPTVIFSGGGGSGAAGQAIIDPNTGAIIGVVITNPGVGYTSAPNVTFSAPTEPVGPAATGFVSITPDVEPLSDYVATVDWKDGNIESSDAVNPNIFIVQASPGQYLVLGTHTYAEESPVGGYQVTTTIAHEAATPSPSVIVPTFITDPAVSGTGNFAFAAVEGTASSVQTVATFTDPGGNAVLEFGARDYTATINWGDGTSVTVATPGSGITINGTTMTVAGGHTYANDGSYTISVLLQHDGAPNTTVTSTATVQDQSVALAAVSALTLTEGQASGQVQVATFTDPAGAESLANYSATVDWGDGTSPSIGTITLNGSTFTVTGAHTYAEESTVDHSGNADNTYHITVTVNHGTAAAASLASSTTATVNDAAVQPVGGYSIAGAATVAVPSQVVAIFIDPAGAEGVGEYSADIDYGDGTGVHVGAGVINTVNGGIFSVSTGPVTYATEGVKTITVTIHHEGSAAQTVTSTAVVGSQALVGAPATVSTTEGTALSSVTMATFTDPDGGGLTEFNAGSYSAIINWGDGTANSPADGNPVTIANPSGFNFAVQGSHTYAEEGFYNATITIFDDGAVSAVVSSIVTVNEQAVVVAAAPGPFIAAEGKQSLVQPVATFTDPAGAEAISEYTALINWNDGSAVETGTITFGGGIFTVSGAHTYAEEGSQAVTVTVLHNGTSADDSASPLQVTVDETPVVALGGYTVTAVEGDAPTGQVVATFTDPAGAESIGNPSVEYSATVTWGNGSTSPGTITFNAGVFTVTALPTASAAAEEGSAAYSVAINHGPTTVTVAGTLTVSDPSVVAVAAPVSAVEGASFTGQVATFTDPGTPAGEALADYSATINWGDGTITTTSPGDITLNAGVFTINGTHTYAEEGNYTTSVTVNHDAAPSVTVTSTTSVSDLSVVFGTSSITFNAVEGTLSAVQPVATFTDPGGNEAIGEYAATIDWGDGNTSVGTIALNAGVYTVLGAHTYAEESGGTPYTISVSVAHGTAPTVSSDNLVLNGGFETGDFTGWTQTDFFITSSVVQSGAFAAGTGSSVLTPLTQTITTVPGDTYTFGFWVNVGTGEAGTEFQALWNGSVIYDELNQPAHGYVFHTFTETAVGTTTQIGFMAQNVPDATYVDSVSVVDTSSPGTKAVVSDPSVLATGGLTLTAVEAQPVATQVVATFSDPGGSEPGDYSATVNWGNGVTGASISYNPSNNTFTVTASDPNPLGDEESSPFPIMVQISHDASAPVTVTDNVAVSDPAVVATAVPVDAVEGASPGGQTLVATFTDPGDPNFLENATEYGATINWGDGSATSLGNITPDPFLPNTWDVVGGHSYAEEGAYNVTVTISHNSAPTTTVTGTAFVADPSVNGVSTPVGFLANPGFENGLTNWTLAPNGIGTTVNNLGSFVQPTEGANFGLIVTPNDPGGTDTSGFTGPSGQTGTDGSVLTSQSFAAAAGTEFTVDYNFLTEETPPDLTFNDFALGQLLDGSNTVIGTFLAADTNSNFIDGGDSGFANQTGWQTATVTIPTGAVGPFTLQFVVSDAGDTNVPSALAIDRIDTVSTLAAVEGQNTGLTPVATFTDPGGAEVVGEYAASINWGDGNTSPGVIALNDGLYTVLGNHTYAEESGLEHAGSTPYQVTVTISHGTALPYMETATTVTVSDPSVLATGGLTLTGAEGTPLSSQVAATFTDPAGSEGTGDYTADVNWGSGFVIGAGSVNFNPTNNTFSVMAGGNTFTEEGTFPVQIRINHESAPSVIVTSQVTVGDAPLTAGTVSTVTSGVEGLTPTSLTATFADANTGAPTGDFSGAINWGDGITTPFGSGAVSGGAGSYTVSGTHQYAEEGTYPVSVTINDVGGSTTTDNGATSVSDPAVVLNSSALSLTAAEGKQAALTVATFTDPGGAEPAGEYSASIHWGDGSPDAPGLILQTGPNTYSVSQIHTFAEETAALSPDQVTVTVTHGSSTPIPVVTANVKVTEQAVVLNSTPILVNALEGAPATLTIATFTDPGVQELDISHNPAPGEYSAVINWGDGSTNSPTDGNAVTITWSGATQSFSVTGTHTYTEEGPYSITVTVSHGANPNNSDLPVVTSAITASASVADQQIVGLTDANAPTGVLEGASFGPTVAIATFTDPAGQGNETVNDFTATVNWGDNTSSPATIVHGAGGNYSVTAPAHTYAEEGTYTETVTVSHDGLPALTSAGQSIVVGDPAVVLNNSALSLTAVEGKQAALNVATFTDPGGAEGVGEYNAIIHWGDGSPDTPGIVTQTGPNTYSVSQIHTFAEETLAASPDQVTVTVTHGSSTPVPVVTATVKVTDPAVALNATPINVNATEGIAQVLTVATFTDPGVQELDLAHNPAPGEYSAVINWGDSSTNSPADGNAVTITWSGATQSFSVTGTHTYTEEGPFAITVTVSHGSNPNNSDLPVMTTALTANAAVADAPLSDTTAANSTVAATEGNAFVNQVLTTFSDANVNATLSDFSVASVTYTNAPVFLTGPIYSVQFVGTTGSVSNWEVVVSGTIAEKGNYLANVQIKDVGGSTVSDNSTTIQVADGALTNTTVTGSLSATEGNAFTGTLMTFFDADPFAPLSDFSVANVTYTGAPVFLAGPTYTVVSLGLSEWAVNVSGTIAEKGNYTAFVTVNDVDGSSATQTNPNRTTIQVADAALSDTTPAPNIVNSVEGNAFSNVVLATFSDANPYATLADFSLSPAPTYSNTPSPNFLTGPTYNIVPLGVFGGVSNWDVTVSGTIAEKGNYTATVNVVDKDGAPTLTDSRTTIVVADAPLTDTTPANGNVSVTERQAFSNVILATFTDANPYATAADFPAPVVSFSPSATFTGTPTYTVQFVPTGVTPNYLLGYFEVLASGTFASAGTFTAIVPVQDTDGSLVIDTNTTVNVTDPSLVAVPAAPISASEGATLTNVVLATFTDPGGAELIGGAPDPAHYGATINWGDFSPTSPGALSFNAGVFTVMGTHTYAEEGNYNIHVLLQHDISANVTVATTAAVSDPAVVLSNAATPFNATLNTFSAAQAVATFTDPGGAEQTLGFPNAGEYAAAINWGDGTPASTGTITFGGGTFTVFGAHKYTSIAGNPYQITVTVLHGTSSGAQAVTDGAAVTQQSVVLNAIPIAVTATESSSFTGAVATFTDPGGAQLTGAYSASINWGDTGVGGGGTSAGAISWNASTQAFTVTGTYTYVEESNAGVPDNITVTITHGSSTPSVSVTATATVADQAVVAVGTPVAAVEGTPFTKTVATFTDPAGAESTGNPSAEYGATITWGDSSGSSPGVITFGGGVFTVQGTHTYAGEGSDTIHVVLSHGTAANVTATATATVSDPSVVPNVALLPFSATVNQTSLSQAVATFTDPGGAEGLNHYTATINWGDGTASSNGTITFDGVSTFTVSGAHKYASIGTGTFPIKVTFNHDTSAPVTATTATATVVLQPAVLNAAPLAFSAVEGTTSAVQTVATFSDPNGSTIPSAFSAIINWGDGSTNAPADGSTVSITYNSATKKFTVTGSHKYIDEAPTGTFPITVTINHGSAAPSTSVTAAATVTDPAVVAVGKPVAGVEGASLTTTVATFTDPGGNTAVEFAANEYSATITWGDSTGSSPGVISLSGGVFTVQGTHTYANTGSYTVRTVISHALAHTTTATGTATVSDPAVVPNVSLLSFNATINQTSAVQPVATFTDPGGAEGLTHYAATINWGDSTASTAGVITVSGGTFTVSGAHKYASLGVFPISVTLHHDSAPPVNGAHTANASVSPVAVALNASPLSFTAVENALSAVQAVATFTDPGGAQAPGAYSATIDWGDSSTTSPTDGFAATITYSSATKKFTVTGQHTYADEGTGSYVITVTVTHGTAVSSSTTAKATVSDPAVVAVGGFAVTAVENSDAGTQTVATFTDPAGNGAAEFVANAYTASINWGDSTPATAGTIVFDGVSTFSVQGDHTYASEGTYTISVTLGHGLSANVHVKSTATVSDPQVVLNSPPLAISPVVNLPSGQQLVATFTDPAGAEAVGTTPNSGAYTATIDWGDGSNPSSGTITYDGVSTFSVFGAHKYTSNAGSPYNVTVTIAHGTSTPASGVTAIATVALTANQTISFTPIASPVTYGVSPITISATASSGLPVTFSVVSGPGMIINGNQLKVTGVGSIVVEADQAGNNQYTAAAPVQQTVVVDKATLNVTANNASKTYGQANPAFSYTITGFVNGDTSSVVTGTPTLSTPATTASGVGVYPINVAQNTLNAANYTFNLVPGSLTINQATLTFTASNASWSGKAPTPTPTAYTVSGFVNGDTFASLFGSEAPSLSISPPVMYGPTGFATQSSYSIVIAQGTLVSPANYALVFVPGTLSNTRRGL